MGQIIGEGITFDDVLLVPDRQAGLWKADNRRKRRRI